MLRYVVLALAFVQIAVFGWFLVQAWKLRDRRPKPTGSSFVNRALTEGRVVKGGKNDLSRWEQYGGMLKRPPPPAPMNVRATAARNGLWTLPPAPMTRPGTRCPECGGPRQFND